jgi:hypothetical protein
MGSTHEFTRHRSEEGHVSRGPSGDFDLRMVSSAETTVVPLCGYAGRGVRSGSPVYLVQMLRVQIKHRQAGCAEFVQILHGAGSRERW